MLPLVAWVPLQPEDAVQVVALVVAQLSVELPPLVMVSGLAPIETVGTGAGVAATVTVALADAVPPLPVQESE